MPIHNSDRKHFKLITAVYLVLRRDNEILLLKRANTGYQDGKYSLIAGHLDGDELATHAMVREAEEEAGISVNADKLKFVHLSHRLAREQVGQERLDIFYELWDWQGEIKNMEPNKCAELSWFPIDKLPDNIIPFVGLVIRDVKNNISYSEYVSEP